MSGGTISVQVPEILRVTEALKSGKGEPSADELNAADVDQTVVLPKVSQIKSCVARSLDLKATKLLKFPSAILARVSLPKRAAKSLTVCMAAVT